ncbi:MAG TPA: formimidoylglutamate deiminase [Actinomycetes bacterium]|nr:formimidoylglutamate deiminase [Actinomycetes bacterium]
MTAWHAELAWLGPGRGVAERVLVEADDDRIVAVREGADPPPGAARLPGLTIPGLANAHSHAFHRALRGRTHRGRGDFWAWREAMYQVAARLDPDRYLELARATYAEMALAGVTAVGEFHYLHHDPAGRPYADPNRMGHALVEAAAQAGVRLTLIDTCYLRGGLDGEPLTGPQLRFGDGDAAAWAERAGALREPAPRRADGAPAARVAAGIHSVRAVDPEGMALVAAWARDRDAPLHLHLSEQRAENQACLAATGRTPAALAEAAGVLGPRTTAVHATHLDTDDVARLGANRTTACLCPTTERDLADGVGPASALAAAGSPLCLGSDSHAVVDLFEEARAVELDERLATERRGHHRPDDLLAAATDAGMRALGWDAGRLAPGQLADLVTVGLDSPRLAGADPADLVDHLVFAATAADVTHVLGGGRPVVEGGRHLLVGDVPAALTRAIRALDDA